ncbi:hypothetical protein [Duffyella gerundensis]|nr:hypothetical protein [Duffyella gerundensis]
MTPWADELAESELAPRLVWLLAVHAAQPVATVVSSPDERFHSPFD